MKQRVLPEFSALGIAKSINPMLPKLIGELKRLRKMRGLRQAKLVVDSGCGQLRHLSTLLDSFPRLCLVDTELQLERKHLLLGKKQTIPQFVEANYPKNRIQILSNKQFSVSSLSADVVFSINVLDVTPPLSRREILKSATRNLSKRGLFASIVPRNDLRTLNLCRSAKKYRDGNIFPNHGAFTFYRNWSNQDLAKLYRKHSLEVVVDISNYRYACLVCELA